MIPFMSGPEDNMADTMGCFERTQDGYLVSDDPGRLDLDVVHGYLTRSYWAEGVPREVVARSIAHSLCFGLYPPAGTQVGFARAITDRATYAYLADVFVREELQGRGLGRFLMACVMEHPDLAGLRRWSLVTRDAHELYRPLGFTSLAAPERYMEIARPTIYKRS
jgi:GNAT superfamily N-acetyltransferase